VRIPRDQTTGPRNIFTSEVEIVQSVFQNRAEVVKGKTPLQRLEFALRTVPRVNSNEVACCECSATFKGVNAVLLLEKHFLAKTTNESHKLTHKLCICFKLPSEGNKSARYYRMNGNGNFGFICEAPGCARYFVNVAALQKHIKLLSPEEIKQHGRYKYLAYAKKLPPYHHLGTRRLDFDVQDV